MSRLVFLALPFLLVSAFPRVEAQQTIPKPAIAASPGIKVLTGLTVPEFEQEMQMMVQALGVSCQFCHVRNDFASEANDHKITARRMLEMTKLINSQFFPSYTPREGDSKLGKVT